MGATCRASNTPARPARTGCLRPTTYRGQESRNAQLVHWPAHGLQPHRVLQFKVSQDPGFVPKLRDIVGLYEVPAGKIVHAILDNYGSHKHPKVRAWLGRHPRFVFHYTPTSCSWLNAVEGFFAKLSRRRLKRGVFRSVVDLQSAINRFVAETNADPKPFTWTANPDKIIAAVKRGHQVLDSIH